MSARKNVRVLLLAVGVAALLVYIAAAAAIGRPPMIRDAFQYNVSAQRLLNTGVYEYNPDLTVDAETTNGPTAFTMPGYTLLLAGIYVFYPHSGDAIAAMQGAQLAVIAVQIALAAASAQAIAYAGYRLAGLRVGWTAGIMAVAYLPFGMNATVALTETLTLALMSGLMLCLVCMFRAAEGKNAAGGFGWAIGFGVFGGLSVLVRPTAALWLVIPLAVFAWRSRGAGTAAWRTPAVAVLVTALLMTPWVVRNAIALDRFVPLTDSASTPLLDSVGGAVFTEAEEAIIEKAEAAGADPYFAVALERLKARWRLSPGEFLSWKARTAWQGVGDFTNLPMDIVIDVSYSGWPSIYAPSKSFLVAGDERFYDALFGAVRWYHLLILALALLGMALNARKPLAWLLLSIPVYYALVHTAILFMVRYFYPAMPALMLLAALGVTSAPGWAAGACRMLRHRGNSR